MEFLEALNEYYKLKNDYDTKKQAKITRILHDDLLKSFKQKRDAMEKNKLQCIGCKQPVGTIFSNKQGILGAQCGNKTSQCGLNIQINRGKYIFLDNLIDVFDEDVTINKEKIIQVKLDLLFHFKNETTVLNTFKQIKDELVEDLETLTNYKTQYVSILTNLENRSEINAKMERFYIIVDTIKSAVQEFNETNNVQLIKDVVSLYRKDLAPLLKELRELKYKYHAIEYNADDNTFCLQRKVFTLNEMSVPFDEPKVIIFNLGNQSANNRDANKNTDNNNSKKSEEYLL
jgi:hypothetical protein